jgi:hypothetical protein
MKDVTGVVINWLSANSTIRAIESLRKFYPDIPIIIVDEGSMPEDKSNFYRIYNGHTNAPDEMYDDDTDKLESVPNSTLYRIPPYSHDFHAGEGLGLDMALKECKTKWMLHFHSDWRFIKGGVIEDLLSYADDKTIGVGDGKTKTEGFPSLSGMCELINAEVGKKFNYTFQPLFLYADGTIDILDNKEPVNYKPLDKQLVSTESYFFGKIYQEGYKVIGNSVIHNYGVHLRWNGEEEWKKYF